MHRVYRRPFRLYGGYAGASKLPCVFGSLATCEQGADMLKASSLILLLALAACSSVPQGQYAASSCSASSPNSYECQIERYLRAP
jgi:hypothetical protein